jgi:protein-L-isoaspartate(D-aspartate) O-methyltransferase
MPTDVFAKLLQHSGINQGSRVLDVACYTGYSTTIIANLCRDIMFIDHDKWLLNRLGKVMKESSLDIQFSYDIIKNFKNIRKIEPFDIIFINGIIDEVPEYFVKNLNSNGKIMCLMRDKYSAQAVCFTKKYNKLIKQELFNVDADDRLRLNL